MSATQSLDTVEILDLADVYEFIDLLIERNQYADVRRLVAKHGDLILRNWQAALCMSVLSHNHFTTRVFANHIFDKLECSELHKVFMFLLELDRVVDISNIYAHDLWHKGPVRDSLNSLQIAHLNSLQRTRKVIADFIQHRLKACVRYEHQTPTVMRAAA